MEMSYLKIAVLVSLLFMAAGGLANTYSNQATGSVRCFLQTVPDDWVLVNIDGKWWWVLYNADGSVNVKIPADF